MDEAFFATREDLNFSTKVNIPLGFNLLEIKKRADGLPTSSRDKIIIWFR